MQVARVNQTLFHPLVWLISHACQTDRSTSIARAIHSISFILLELSRAKPPSRQGIKNDHSYFILCVFRESFAREPTLSSPWPTISGDDKKIAAGSRSHNIFFCSSFFTFCLGSWASMFACLGSCSQSNAFSSASVHEPSSRKKSLLPWFS